MRSIYVPVQLITLPGSPKATSYVPDWLNTRYVGQIQNLPVSQRIVLEDRYVPYPELLSNDIYGTVDYWWVLCMYNGIVDIFNDMQAGLIWNIPALSDIQAMLSPGAAATAGGSSAIGTVAVI